MCVREMRYMCVLFAQSSTKHTREKVEVGKVDGIITNSLESWKIHFHHLSLVGLRFLPEAAVHGSEIAAGHHYPLSSSSSHYQLRSSHQLLMAAVYLMMSLGEIYEIELLNHDWTTFPTGMNWIFSRLCCFFYWIFSTPWLGAAAVVDWFLFLWWWWWWWWWCFFLFLMMIFRFSSEGGGSSTNGSNVWESSGRSSSMSPNISRQ